MNPISGATDLTLLRPSILYHSLSTRWQTHDDKLSNLTFSLNEKAKSEMGKSYLVDDINLALVLDHDMADRWWQPFIVTFSFIDRTTGCHGSGSRSYVVKDTDPAPVHDHDMVGSHSNLSNVTRTLIEIVKCLRKGSVFGGFSNATPILISNA